MVCFFIRGDFWVSWESGVRVSVVYGELVCVRGRFFWVGECGGISGFRRFFLVFLRSFWVGGFCFFSRGIAVIGENRGRWVFGEVDGFVVRVGV